MNRLLTNAVFFLPVLAFALGCNEESQIADNTGSVTTQAPLQYGFEGRSVAIEFNGTKCFEAPLSDGVPLSGPLAIFETRLPRGTNKLKASWKLVSDPLSGSHQDSTTFVLGNEDKYFLGIGLVNDSLRVTVSNSGFDYI